MKITFSIRYRTSFGEHIEVEIRGEEPTRIEMSTCDGELWSGVLEFDPEGSATKIEYSYALYRGEELLRREILSTLHLIEVESELSGDYRVDDVWRDLPCENYRYSAAFNKHTSVLPSVALSPQKGYITLRALVPGLSREGLSLGVVGSIPAMGSWVEPIIMREIVDNMWSVSLSFDGCVGCVDYKFVVIERESGKIRRWEEGDNRTLVLSDVECGQNLIKEECEPRFDAAPILIAGSAIPIFSLRSEGGCGVGDFGDLREYITWAAETGQQAVQILPINDTTINNTWQDSYPYNSISIYAFNPMYIDLRGLPALRSTEAMADFERERAEVNALPALDYERVNVLKRGYLHAIFDQEGSETLATEEFVRFFDDNREWLLPYAAFSYLRDEAGSADFTTWSRLSRYDSDEVEAMCSRESAEYDKIAYYYYVQYLLHTQLLEAATEARRLGVILKGDIPIGISRESVEAWVEPYYFNMNGQAGAPPDAFSVNGQNWGFPTYNWEVMQRDNYRWWRRRFAKMSEYFTAYRIDHILGFFRIWEIPEHSVHGLLGQFAPSMPMSEAEIEEWGLHFRRDFMICPFISDAIVDELFGDESDMVRTTYLRPLDESEGTYALRDEFATQRQIEAHFRGAVDGPTLRLKESLYSLVSNVLFVCDRDDETMYHPRISVQNDFVFRELSEPEREAFNRLYEHYYYQRHNDFWYQEAMKKLPVLTCSTSMLVCGEDLGMVPGCVAPVMEQLQIISLEIERMPKGLGEVFGHPARYPHGSVCTIGTHDMSTLRGWWREEPELRVKYYYDELRNECEVPDEMSGELCREVVKRHLDSPSMLVILTWQDWLSIDESLRNPDIEAERINIPANPRHYWRWRMHLTIEELRRSKGLNEQIAKMIGDSGRSV